MSGISIICKGFKQMEGMMASQYALIRTKYSKPINSPWLISRNHLSEKLSKAIDHKLTVMTAPAGYGKSTAVNEWLKSSGIPYAWVSLDEGDNDPVVFWKYVCAALDGIVKDICKDASYVFSSQELLNSNVHLSIIIDKLSDIDYHFVLVLDDFHYITDENILKEIVHLIDFLPSKMHMVIIGRKEPDLKLERHGVKGNLARIGINNLRFRQEEIAEFYKARGFSLTREDVRKVENYTEGWAAALVVAMSMEEEENHGNVINRLESCDTHIYRYL